MISCGCRCRTGMSPPDSFKHESQKFIFKLIFEKSQNFMKLSPFPTISPKITVSCKPENLITGFCSLECHFVADFYVNPWLFSSDFKRRHYRCRSFVCIQIINLTLSEIFGEWKLDYNRDINSVCTWDAFSTLLSGIIHSDNIQGVDFHETRALIKLLWFLFSSEFLFNAVCHESHRSTKARAW